MTFVGLLGVVFSRCKGADHILSTPRTGTTSVVASVALMLAGDVLFSGDTVRARVEVRDTGHRVVQPQLVTWKSADETVAAVSAQGLVTGIGHGSTEIVAAVEGVQGSARVYVLDSTAGGAVPPVEPELPRDSVDVTWRPHTGRTIRVGQGDNLQNALESARRGDEVVIEAGAEFRGHFKLPAKSGTATDGWITVRTSALDQLPPQGTRIDPAKHAALMPKLVTPDLVAALSTAPGASGWRVVGIEVTVAPDVGVMPQIQQGIVLLGDGSGQQRTPQQIPSELILDRVYIHGRPNTNTKRCVALNSARTAIIDSQLLECHGKGFDSQAIATWNGPGPYLIQNNRLEAAGEVIIFGGDRPAVDGLIPTDITIRRNYLGRPMSWKGVWTVKTIFELKNAQRVLVEGNVMENNWLDAQIGFAVVMASADASYPWCVVRDVTFRYNHIHNSAGGINLFDHYGNSTPMHRVAVRHNLLTSIGESGLGANGRMFQLNGKVDDLAIENNTGFAPRIYITFGDQPRAMERFSFRNNLGGDADFPVHGGRGNGAQAVALYTAPGSRFERNVIVTRSSTRALPPNNTYLTARNLIGFTEGVTGIEASRLSRESQYRATGVDIDELLRRLGNAVGDAPAPRRR